MKVAVANPHQRSGAYPEKVLGKFMIPPQGSPVFSGVCLLGSAFLWDVRKHKGVLPELCLEAGTDEGARKVGSKPQAFCPPNSLLSRAAGF